MPSATSGWKQAMSTRAPVRSRCSDPTRSGAFASIRLLGGSLLFFKLRAQHTVFVLQGVELVVERRKLLFELTRDDALIELVPAHRTGRGTHGGCAPGDEAGLFPVNLADELEYGALVKLFAAQQRGRGAFRAHGEKVKSFGLFHRVVLLDAFCFSSLKVSCRTGNVNRGDALQWRRKRAMIAGDF